MQPDPNNPNQPVSGPPVSPLPMPMPQPLATPAAAPQAQPVPVPEPSVTAAPELLPNPEVMVTPVETVVAPTTVTPAVVVAPAVDQPAVFPQPSIVAPVEPTVTTPTVQPVFDVIAPQVVSSEPVAMVNPVNMPVAASSQSSKGKVFKIVGGIVAALIILIVLAVVGIGLTAKQQIVYKLSDLTKATTKTYRVSYAKQWTDLSANKSVLNYLKTSLGSETSLVDQKIYGYKYDPKTDQGQTLLLVAVTPLGVSDDELKRGLADPTAKQQFESSFKDLTGSLDSDNLCQSVTGKHESNKYDTSKFLVEVKADVDCNYTQANQTKYGTKGIHQVIFLGIKNGNTYLATLVASQSDWAKNGTFYNDNVLSSLNPL